MALLTQRSVGSSDITKCLQTCGQAASATANATQASRGPSVCSHNPILPLPLLCVNRTALHLSRGATPRLDRASRVPPRRHRPPRNPRTARRRQPRRQPDRRRPLRQYRPACSAATPGQRGRRGKPWRVGRVPRVCAPAYGRPFCGVLVMPVKARGVSPRLDRAPRVPARRCRPPSAPALAPRGATLLIDWRGAWSVMARRATPPLDRAPRFPARRVTAQVGHASRVAVGRVTALLFCGPAFGTGAVGADPNGAWRWNT